MRLFVSVDLPDDLAPALAAIQEDLRGAPGLSFVDPAQAHLTLKFLGDTDPARLEDLEAALAAAVDEADVAPFDAAVAGLGAFPSIDYIRVVWLGFGAGAAELTRLHEAVEGRTTDLGFDPESHEFTPHVTLARMQHAGGKERVQRALRERHPEVGAFRVEEVRLTESVLGPDGPTYSTVARFPLG